MSQEFYIVPTPIGNLKDITYRAVEVLKSVDFIACEDTRVTKKLLDKYQITAKLIDCHKFNEKERSEKIISLIESGKTVALVSDAGTPLISDPGSILISELIKENINIISLPGACAVTTFLSRIPRDNEEFAFIGFIPREEKRQIEILNKYKYTNCVFYDSPHRLIDTLKNISKNFGGDTKIAVARELTKVFEEIKIDRAENIINYYNENPLKGEIAVMVYASEKNELTDEELIEKIKLLKEEGFSPKDISKILSKLLGENKNHIYKLAIS